MPYLSSLHTNTCLKVLIVCPLPEEAGIVGLAGTEAGEIAAAWFGKVLRLVFVSHRQSECLELDGDTGAERQTLDTSLKASLPKFKTTLPAIEPRL